MTYFQKILKIFVNDQLFVLKIIEIVAHKFKHNLRTFDAKIFHCNKQR